jgi:hypothetical protein
MKAKAQVTLTENSTAGNGPKVFSNQEVEITNTPPTVQQSVDGPISVGRHESTVIWHGGKAADLKTITNVRIVGSDGQVLIDGELCNTFEAPKDFNGGVKFSVL